MTAIQIEKVCKAFQKHTVLDQVSLSIQEGEFFGLLGPNGAGKTTLISILAGLCRADAGHVQILGHDVVRDFKTARRLVGVVPQELVFDPFFTVRETLRWQSGYFGLRKNDAWIDEVMASLGLLDKADVNMRALSGGMKRRVLVAQALVHKPPVIVLDEPTAGVDVELRQTLWKFIARLNCEGHTVVLTTHYLEEAQSLCHKIAMLKQGCVVAQDSTAALLKRISGSQFRFRIVEGVLPSVLVDRVLPKETLAPHNVFTFRVAQSDDVEHILATLRQHQVCIDDMELKQADLEDVFLQIMAKEEVL